MKELQILSPDGKSRMIPFEGDRLCLGRSTTVALSYPNDSGLSRQHTLLEREGDDWTIVDLGSKNGTMLNGQPLTVKTVLKSGDRIMAGHLIMICDKCGHVEEIEDPALSRTLATVAKKHGHTLKHHVIELHGICCSG